MQHFSATWRSAFVGELCWIAADGCPAGIPVVPLILSDAPCLALPFVHDGVAAELRNAPEVAFAVTDPRALPEGAPGAAVYGSITVTSDIDGELFTGRLLEQELRKHPPSRRLADSPLLRRENWWWLPRFIIRLDRLVREQELPPRHEALLVRDEPAGLRLDVVEAARWDDDLLQLHAAAGPLRGDGGTALAFGHDYSLPDLERWELWTRLGQLCGDMLAVRERTGAPEQDLEPHSLRARIRNHRELERGCRRGIKAAAGRLT